MLLQGGLLVQSGVAHVLVDGVDGHLGDVLRRLTEEIIDVNVSVLLLEDGFKAQRRPEVSHLCLDVERDEAVCDQVVDGLEPLLSDEVLPVMVEAEVSRLVPKPGMCLRQKIRFSFFAF